jgi:hypothetical protein
MIPTLAQLEKAVGTAVATLNMVAGDLAMLHSLGVGAPQVGKPRARASLIPDRPTGQTITGTKPGTNAWKVGKAAMRPNGVTRQEALEITGYRAISVRQQLEQYCKIRVIHRKVRGEWRFYA